MRRATGPIQQWVDSIPSPTKPVVDVDPQLGERVTPPSTPVSTADSLFANPSMTVSSPIAVPSSPAITMTGLHSPVHHNRLARDPSFQSDSSHCSSVESLLEFRRADPEAVLLGLGFGGCTTGPQENGPLSRIPKRFLQPSKLKGIAINDFVKQQQETSESLDSASLGYRGLTGSPYVAPSEIVQKIMERLREHESHEQDAYTVHNTEPYSPIFQDTSRLSVLSPDNRQFLERPRSKSPDMRNKRMIIGEKSFAFDCDGDLIEIDQLCRDNEARPISTNGNTDNHSTELDENSSTTGPTSETPPKSSRSDQAKGTKGAKSNVRRDKRLAKQLSMDDGAQDSIPSDDDFYSRSCERSLDSSSVDESRNPDSGERGDRWKARSDDARERTSIGGSRRASDGLCDKTIPTSRLLREEGRRYSDSGVRQTSGLQDRRKSLKRQSRVSEAEVAEFCESESRSEPVVLEVIERSDCGEERECPDVPETTKVEANETEERITRSDRLSASGDDFSRESPTDVNSKDNVDGETDCTEKVKNRPVLATLCEMHTSVMSIRMEPGF